MTHEQIIEEMAKAIYDAGGALVPSNIKAMITRLDQLGWQITEKEPDDQILAAATPAMEDVNNALAIVANRGRCIQWVDGKPPLYHAYKAMSEKGRLKV